MTELLYFPRSYSAPNCSNTQTYVDIDRPAVPRPLLTLESYDWLQPSMTSQSKRDLWEDATEPPIPLNTVVSIVPQPSLLEAIQKKRMDQALATPPRQIIDVPRRGTMPP